MANQAVEYGVEFPFVKDADCKVADALGVTRTPEVAVLDAKHSTFVTAAASTINIGPAASARADAQRPGRRDRRRAGRQAGRGRVDAGRRLP